MFSATFAGNVGNLARNLLRDPKRIDVASHTDTHENIEQRLHWADNHHHKNALLDHILTQKDMEQAVVFTSTQRDADMLADRLADMGHSGCRPARWYAAGPSQPCVARFTQSPVACARGHRRRGTRH
jgi:superfamily II DNA/RNA helicase